MLLSEEELNGNYDRHCINVYVRARILRQVYLRTTRETDVTLTPARSSSVALAALITPPPPSPTFFPLPANCRRVRIPLGFGKDPREEGGLEFPYTHRRPPPEYTHFRQ